MMRWAPPVALAIGALFTVGVDTQRTMKLQAALNTSVPVELHGFQGADLSLTDEERRVAGVSDYLVRSYAARPGVSDSLAFTLYVGYYDRQTQKRTIHSPKNCLPGAGWEALASQTERVLTPGGEVTVNRYLIHKGKQRALVFYWYQGRGRVEANEYRVKWDLLRDAALRHRTEEALVRIVVPVNAAEVDAAALGTRVVQLVVPAVARALPS